MPRKHTPLIQPLPWTPEQHGGGMYAINDKNGVTVCVGLSKDEAELICRSVVSTDREANLLAPIAEVVQEMRFECENSASPSLKLIRWAAMLAALKGLT